MNNGHSIARCVNEFWIIRYSSQIEWFEMIWSGRRSRFCLLPHCFRIRNWHLPHSRGKFKEFVYRNIFKLVKIIFYYLIFGNWVTHRDQFKPLFCLSMEWNAVICVRVKHACRLKYLWTYFLHLSQDGVRDRVGILSHACLYLTTTSTTHENVESRDREAQQKIEFSVVVLVPSIGTECCNRLLYILCRLQSICRRKHFNILSCDRA